MAKKRRISLKGTPYDSLLEKEIHETKLSSARFHDKSDKVSYTVPHTYEPDFVLDKDDHTFYIETKGRFRDSAEARKYLYVRDNLPENAELVFVWGRGAVAFPFAKKRKDGTKATHEEWADKHGFRHWVQDNFSVDVL